MPLFESQKIIADNVLNIINNLNNNDTENRFAVINIIGDVGSGKSEIAKAVINSLSEIWHIHEIVGNDRNEIDGINMPNPRKIKFHPNPQFSLNLGIISFSSNFRFQESDSILKDIEKQFIQNVNQDYGYSVIFVDNYERLDEITKKFVNTISSFNRVDTFYNHFPIVFIITSETRIYNDKEIHIFKTSDITTNEIMQIGAYNNIDERRATQIKLLSGNNLKFVKMLIDSNSDIFESVSQIIDKRIDEISKIGQIDNIKDIEDICVCGAYFECGFSAEHVFKVINKYSIDQIYELFVNLNNCLILKNRDNLNTFTVDDFKKAFIARRINFEYIYFERMAKFYERYYDYEYLTRANFEFKKFLYNQNESKAKTIALIFMSIITKIYERKITDTIEIDEMLTKFLKIDFPKNLKEVLYAIVNNNLTYELIDRIILDNYDDILIAELIRIKLTIISKEICETEIINNLIKSAIACIKELESTNIEKYLLITLQEAILSEIINHSTLFEMFDKQIENFHKFINNYKYSNPILNNEYLNRFKRKSSLYLNCDMSIRKIKDAIVYFEEHKNIYELYNCYVNLFGLYAVSSRFDKKECNNYKDDFDNMLKLHKLTFADSYKNKHNMLLLNYLKSNKKSTTNKEFLALAKKYYDKYRQLNKKYNKNILLLNQVSLCCLWDIKQAHLEIDDFIKSLLKARNLDNFYLINLYNLKCMLHIVEQDWEKAEQTLSIISNYKMPIFNCAKRYYEKRLETLETIIKNKIVCSTIMEYDNLIYKINSEGLYNMPIYFGEEEGWRFYSKSFILTDMQFFS